MDWNPLLNAVIRHDMTAMVMPNPLLDLLAEMCKELNGHKLRLQHLESAPLKEVGATQRSGNSFAHTTGPVEKPSESPSVSPVFAQELSALTGQIMALCRSTLSIEPELEATWLGSSTLQLTLQWPTPSGANKAGNHGPAGPIDPRLWDRDLTETEMLDLARSPSAAPASPAGSQDSPSRESSKCRTHWWMLPAKEVWWNEGATKTTVEAVCSKCDATRWCDIFIQPAAPTDRDRVHDAVATVLRRRGRHAAYIDRLTDEIHAALKEAR